MQQGDTKMETKNLFDFATKELSQDAFLRWLLENFNDPVVGIASKKLLSEMIKLFPDQPLDIDKITEIKTWAQYKNMDVGADVYVGQNKVATFVIEDKTNSSEHNQLEKYDGEIDKWNDQKYKYRIFYKTQLVGKEERERITKNNKWKIMDIKTISSIFSEFTNSDNLVLKYYSLHVTQVLSDLSDLPNISDAENWNFNQTASYFKKKVLESNVLDKYKNRIATEDGTYLGRYIWFRVYYKLENDKYLDPKRSKSNNFWDSNLCYPLIEFIFRPGNKNKNVIVYTHITYKFYSNQKRNWTWKNKSNELSKDLYSEIDPSKVNDNLKDLLNANGIKCRKMDSPKAQTISSVKIKKEDIVKDNRWEEEIAKYLDIFSQLNQK